MPIFAGNMEPLKTDFSRQYFNMDFFSALSHELRTPLNAIISLMPLLNAEGGDNSRFIQASLRQSARKLLSITNGINDFALLQNGELVLEPEKEVPLRKSLNELGAIYSEYAKASGLNFEWLIDEDLNELYEVDVNRLLQILEVLLSNALKFTKAGYIKFELKIKERDIEADTICFSVSDSGDGIAHEQLEDIFRWTTYLQLVTTRKHVGTGLGLSIAQHLLQLFESKIEVESEPGKSSRFHFDLKLKRVVTVTNEPRIEDSVLKNKSCLLAEDNDLNTFVAQAILGRWGVKVEVACNGLEAITKSFETKYDFILMDVQMPEMNGYDATRSIRQQGNPNQNTPIFALTADVAAAESDEDKHWFDGFLWKPIEVDKLYSLLLSAMS